MLRHPIQRFRVSHMYLRRYVAIVILSITTPKVKIVEVQQIVRDCNQGLLKLISRRGRKWFRAFFLQNSPPNLPEKDVGTVSGNVRRNHIEGIYLAD